MMDKIYKSRVKKTIKIIGLILVLSIFYSISLFIGYEFASTVGNRIRKISMVIINMVVIFIALTSETISLYFLYKNKIKRLIHTLILTFLRLGVLIFGVLLLGLLILEGLKLKKFDYILISIIAETTYYSFLLVLLLLLNATITIWLSTVIMFFSLLVPKYRALFKSKIIPYIMLATYSTMVWFIGTLLHAFIFYDSDNL